MIEVMEKVLELAMKNMCKCRNVSSSSGFGSLSSEGHRPKLEG